MTDHLRQAGGALRSLGRGLAGGLLGLALPPTCISCGRVTGAAGALCGPCWGRLAFITAPICDRTGTPFAFDAGAPQLSPEAVEDPPAYDRARAAVLFTDVARDLVHNLKYADRMDLAAPMARLMAQAGRELLTQADLIMPVPLHPLRLWQRRFNQAALLARHISACHAATSSDGSSPQLRCDLLKRRRATRSQTTLTRAERRANVDRAFAVPPFAMPEIAGRRILVVDDVATTGATLNACATVLRRAGAAQVDALTFARVVDFA